MKTVLAFLVCIFACTFANAIETPLKEYENTTLHSCCTGKGDKMACTTCSSLSTMKIKNMSVSDKLVEFIVHDGNGSCAVKERFKSSGKTLRSEKWNATVLCSINIYLKDDEAKIMFDGGDACVRMLCPGGFREASYWFYPQQ